MFCTCSRICSISTFMSTPMRVSSSAADLEPSVLASRCSSWIRKSSRLPSFAALLEQALDFVQVRAQAGDFFGHVDANGKRRGFGQRAVLRGFWQRAARGQPMASCQRSRKRARCCSTSLGTSGAACCARVRNSAQMALQHHGQPGAFALPRRQQGLERRCGQAMQRVGPVAAGRALVAGQAQHVGHAQVAAPRAARP